MRIKKIQAKNIAEGLKIVQSELGPEALILSTTQIGSGSKEMIEITAALDGGRRSAGTPPANRLTAALDRAAADSRGREPSRRVERPAPPRQAPPRRRPDPNLRRDVRKTLERRAPAAVESVPPFISRLTAFLRSAGVHGEIIARIVGHLRVKSPQSALKEADSARTALISAVQQVVRTQAPLQLPARRPHVLAVVGPTGVGKTTSIAKIASQYKLQNGKKVGLISIDTFRIAAIEQLRAFADIAEMPLSVAYTPAQTAQAIEKYAGMDVVLVDTPGCSPRNNGILHELRGFLEDANIREIHLACSLTTRYAELEEILRHYAALSFNRLLLTKVDEVLHPAAILNSSRLTPSPLVYVTHGQNIPDDVIFAASESLMNMIISDMDIEAWIS